MIILIKKYVIFFLLILITFNAFSENLLLKDGRIFKGKLVDINKKNITLEINEDFFLFPIIGIEYLVSQVTQTAYSLLWLKRKDGSTQKVFLIKLTETALFYKSQNDNELKIIKLSNVDQIFLYSDIDISGKIKDKVTLNKEQSMELNNEIVFIAENLVKIKNKNRELTKSQKEEIEILSKGNKLSYDDIDFYEKFWARLSNFLDSDRENLLWNLLEGYSEKEKSINLLYENNTTNQKYNIKDKIIELRKDFYRRAKKIALSS